MIDLLQVNEIAKSARASFKSHLFCSIVGGGGAAGALPSVLGAMLLGQTSFPMT